MLQIKVTDFKREEVCQAVSIQIQELSEGFLSSFGPRALGLIFTHISQSRWGIFVIAVDSASKHVLGYILGAVDTSRLYREFLLKKAPVAAIFFLPKMLSLTRIKKAFETLLYPAKERSAALPKAELLDLAVRSDYHGTGVAQQLFKTFVAECKSRGLEDFKIPTSKSLVRAHRFYEKMGAKRQASSIEIHKGAETFVYVFDVNDHVEEISQ